MRRVSRTLAFVWVPRGLVYNEKTLAFTARSPGTFALLQSAIHEYWAWRFSSTLKADLNYTPSDCFETFPFPQSPTDAQQAALDQIGETYHEHRRQLMLANNEGLTKTYNRFHDPHFKDAAIQRLRDLHVEMDLAVRDAYGWTELDLGHDWHTSSDGDPRFTIAETARREVLRRLLALNHEIHEREVAAAPGAERAAKAAKSRTAAKTPKPVRGDQQTLSLFGNAQPPAGRSPQPKR